MTDFETKQKNFWHYSISFCLDADLPSQRTCYMEGECYDYDADIDELFHLAAKVICPAGHEEVCIYHEILQLHAKLLLKWHLMLSYFQFFYINNCIVKWRLGS